MKKKKNIICIVIITTIVISTILLLNLWPNNKKPQNLADIDKNYMKELNTAISHNREDEVKELLKQNKDINATVNFKKDYDEVYDDEYDPYDGRTPLTLACYKGNLNIVKLLIEKNADVNLIDEYNESPLYVSIESENPKNRYDIISLLFQKGATPTSNVTQKNQDLLNNVAVICSNCIFSTKAEQDKILQDNLKMFKLFEKEGVDINTKDKDSGFTPLMSAAQGGNIYIVKYLVEEKKININETNISNSTYNITSSGLTPLMVAVRWISSSGYNDGGKFVPFENDVARLTTVIDYLLSKGADKTIKDENGKSALDYAKESKNQKVIDMLNN